MGETGETVRVESERNRKEEKVAEGKVQKETATKNTTIVMEYKQEKKKPLFETQENKRSIRTKQDVTTRKPKQGQSMGWMAGAALFFGGAGVYIKFHNIPVLVCSITR